MPVIDDVFFFPENAQMVATTYNIPFGPASVTHADGEASFIEYDKLGRQRLVYDRDRNIVKRTTYNYDIGNPLEAGISVPYLPLNVGTAATFTAAANPCLTGLTYEWDWGSGFTSGSVSQAHTFTAAATYTVKMRVTHATYGSKIATMNVVVVHPPLQADICAKGVQEYNGGVLSSYSCSAITSSPPTSTGVIFKATPTNAVGGETFTYTWLKRDLNASTWTSVGTGNQYTFAKVMPTTPSFAMKCDITSSLGRTLSTGSLEVIVTYNP